VRTESDADELRKASAENVQVARLVERGVLPTDPRLANRNEGLVGYDFSCDVVADRRPIIGSPDEKAAKVPPLGDC